MDVASIVNANNDTVASYLYNAEHQPTQITDLTGTVTTLTYTAWGAPATVSAQGHTTAMTYNAAGRLTGVSRDGASLGSTTYDEKGRAKTQTDAAGFTVSYEYNNLDHVTKISYPDGTSVEYDYTCCGLPGVVKDRSGQRTYYDYDVMRRLARVQDVKGDTLQMDYDGEGNLTRLLDGKGSITKWEYDGLNRLTKKIYTDNTQQTYNYSGGKLAGTTDARGQTTAFSYDDNGNLSLMDYAQMADVSLTYNTLDKPQTMTDGLGTTSFGYDTAGRLTSVNGPWQNDTVSYGYDAEGRRQSLNVQKPTSGNDTTTYAYDALGRLDALTSSAGSFDYSYVGNTGRIAQLLLPNGTKTTYSYTALGELDTVSNQKADGSNLSFYDYDYDTRGVRTQLQEQIEADPVKTLAFSYDPSNQLTGDTVSGGQTGEAYSSSYAYDSAGNRKSWQKDSAGTSQLTRYTNNNLNQTQSASLTINGQRTTTGYSYDAAGNLSQATTENGSSDYTFDGANRLTSVINRNAAGEAVSKSEFVYDGLSRLRVSKDFTRQKVGWVAVAEKRRVYDGMNVVQERDGTNERLAFYTRGLDMGGGIGGLLARSGDGVNLFYHYDGRGNVGQLTNAGGELAARYTYDAFGVLIGSSGAAASLNAYRFSTKEAIGSLVYYGYRFYSPSLGKWINRDPIKENGGVNVYRFVFNSPNVVIDPDGLAGIVVTLGGSMGVGGGPFLSGGAGIEGGIGLFTGGSTCGAGANAALIGSINAQAGGSLVGGSVVDSAKPPYINVPIPPGWADQWDIGAAAGAGVTVCITNADCAAEYAGMTDTWSASGGIFGKMDGISGSAGNVGGKMVYALCRTWAKGGGPLYSGGVLISHKKPTTGYISVPLPF